MNARFWTLTGTAELVRLTLRPGQTLTYRYGGPDEEGWSRTTETYHFANGIVTRTMFSEGRDCDGRHSGGGVSRCHLKHLNSRAPFDEDQWPDVRFPAWKHGDQHQRDYTAEAAGY